MKKVTLFAGSVLFGIFGLVHPIAAEQSDSLSQKTAEAARKLVATPATIGKSLEALTGAARARLQSLGNTSEASSKPPSEELVLPPRRVEKTPLLPYSTDGKRDPFRPPTVRATSSRPKDSLAPLERVELSMINLVGIIWDSKEPKAMIEVAEPGDSSRGYIAKVGTSIGNSDGTVKAITKNELVIQESYTDLYGTKRTREVSKKLSTEQ
jgi:Tfp pilus assembly protein PilP